MEKYQAIATTLYICLLTNFKSNDTCEFILGLYHSLYCYITFCVRLLS